MPDDEKKQRLEMTVAGLQARLGARAVRRLGEGGGAVTGLPTGFATLNQALGIGGLPCGRISELIGRPTSGLTTLALKMAASAQQQGLGNEAVVYLDLERTFDPDYAARCGLRLEQLVLARPEDARQGLRLVQDLVMAGGLAALVCDLPTRRLAEPRPAQALLSMLGRMVAPLSRTECVLLFLSSLPVQSQATPKALLDCYPPGLNLAHYASVRLLLQRERWLYRRGDISGCQAQVLVLKNRFGPAGQSVTLTILFAEALTGP